MIKQLTPCEQRATAIAVVSFHRAMRKVPTNISFELDLLPLFHQCGDAAMTGCWDAFDHLTKRLRDKLLKEG